MQELFSRIRFHSGCVMIFNDVKFSSLIPILTSQSCIAPCPISFIERRLCTLRRLRHEEPVLRTRHADQGRSMGDASSESRGKVPHQTNALMNYFSTLVKVGPRNSSQPFAAFQNMMYPAPKMGNSMSG